MLEMKCITEFLFSLLSFVAHLALMYQMYVYFLVGKVDLSL